LGHIGIDFDSPISECLIILELGNEFQDFLHSFIRSANLIVLDISHLLLISGEIFRERRCKTDFRWKIDRFTSSFSIVDKKAWLRLILELDFPPNFKVFEHSNFSERLGWIFLVFMVECNRGWIHIK